MTFNSVPYLILLGFSVAIYWMLAARFRRLFVLAASVGFYATWGIVFVWVPLLVATIVYIVGRQITDDVGRSKLWLRLGLVILVGLLAFLKYRGFFLANLGFLGSPFTSHAFSPVAFIAFPIGMSFYTFEAIAYLVDLRQGRVKLPGFAELCLYFYFWPNILSGPIVRARELMPQLGFGKSFEAQFVFEGIDRLVWGLVQKNFVANLLGVWVDKGFLPEVGKIPSTMDGWFLAIAFALQIYFDFAGYTNMAIGTARLLGVTLPENFRQPYLAGNPAEFWTRWHMTLSRWVRDYLFFPINSRWVGAPAVLYGSMIGVMALVGLWHGAGWGFIVWGFLHGFYLVIYRAYEVWEKERPGIIKSRLGGIVWRVLTLIGVTAAWVPFRAVTLSKAGGILSAMFYRFKSGREFGSGFYLFTLVVALFCVVEPLVLRKLGEMDERAGVEEVSVFRVLWRPILYLCGLVLFLIFDEHNTQFIYSQF